MTIASNLIAQAQAAIESGKIIIHLSDGVYAVSAQRTYRHTSKGRYIRFDYYIAGKKVTKDKFLEATAK